jgi:hypothetical protein
MLDVGTVLCSRGVDNSSLVDAAAAPMRGCVTSIDSETGRCKSGVIFPWCPHRFALPSPMPTAAE